MLFYGSTKFFKWTISTMEHRRDEIAQGAATRLNGLTLGKTFTCVRRFLNALLDHFRRVGSHDLRLVSNLSQNRQYRRKLQPDLRDVFRTRPRRIELNQRGVAKVKGIDRLDQIGQQIRHDGIKTALVFLARFFSSSIASRWPLCLMRKVLTRDQKS